MRKKIYNITDRQSVDTFCLEKCIFNGKEITCTNKKTVIFRSLIVLFVPTISILLLDHMVLNAKMLRHVFFPQDF